MIGPGKKPDEKSKTNTNKNDTANSKLLRRQTSDTPTPRAGRDAKKTVCISSISGAKSIAARLKNSTKGNSAGNQPPGILEKDNKQENKKITIKEPSNSMVSIFFG